MKALAKTLRMQNGQRCPKAYEGDFDINIRWLYEMEKFS
jgi:hypothetical protein